jgi:LuxR family transcriptional activator of bioluminescence operon
MGHKLTDILASIAAAQTTGDLAKRFEAVFASFGYDNYTYLLLSQPNAVPPTAPDASGNVFWLSNLPQAWVRHYDQQRYASIDPIIRECAVSRLPIRWTERYRAKTRTTAERLVMDDAWENGIKRGLTIPLHGRDEFGIISLHSGLNDDEFQKAAEHSKFEIQVIVQHFHEAARRLMARSRGAPSRRAVIETGGGHLKIYPYGPTYSASD